MALALRGQQTRGRALLGALAGVVFYGLNLPWLTAFSVPGYVAATVLESGMLAAAAALVPAARTGRWSGGWWTLPAALVLLEAVQTRFPYGGFPLPTLVLSQAGGPFAAAAPLGGSLLVTATAAAGGIALAALVTRGARRRLIQVSIASVVAVAPLVGGTFVTTTDAGTLDAVVVQGGGPRGVRAFFTDPADTMERQLAVLDQVTDTPDLVVLPENAIIVDGTLDRSRPDAQFAAQARRLDTTLVAGVVESEAAGFRNAAVLWGPDGRRLARYEKEHRVPFGEYIPARGLVERVTDAAALVPRDAIVGRGEALLASPVGPLGVVISYEIFFADRVREAVTAGGQVVLVPTSAASFVTGEVPAMEVAAARLRAREFGRSVVQAAPTGYSVIVLPDGKVAAQSPLGTAALLREEVPLRTGLTPYARLGDLPVLALALLALAMSPLRLSVSSTRRPSAHRAHLPRRP